MPIALDVALAYRQWVADPKNVYSFRRRIGLPTMGSRPNTSSQAAAKNGGTSPSPS